MNYKIDKLAETRELYTFEEKNYKGEKIQVEFTKCIVDSNSKSSLPYLWFEKGYTDKLLDTYWSVDVFATEENGHCWGKYNPTIKKGEYKLNFKWVLEATEENKQKILNEIIKRAYKMK